MEKGLVEENRAFPEDMCFPRCGDTKWSRMCGSCKRRPKCRRERRTLKSASSGLGCLSSPNEPDRIDIVDSQRQATADRVDLGAVMIGRPPEQADLSGLRPLGARFEEAIELVGWQAVADSAEPAELQVDLGWRALDRSVTDYTAFVHVLDGDGRIVAQRDLPPGRCQPELPMGAR